MRENSEWKNDLLLALSIMLFVITSIYKSVKLDRLQTLYDATLASYKRDLARLQCLEGATSCTDSEYKAMLESEYKFQNDLVNGVAK